jgi:hypothetical protein
MKTFLEEVDRLPAGDAAAIRERIGAPGIQAIETAGFLSWLPVASNLEATRAVTAVLGAKRSHAFFAELGSASYRTPLMQGLVRAVAATAGHDPARFLEWTQKAMTILFADMGTWRVVDRTKESAVLVADDLPAEVAADEIWLTSVAATLESVLTLAQRDGVVRGTAPARDRRRVEFHVRWTEPGA